MPTLYVGSICYNRVKLDSKEYPLVLCDMALGFCLLGKVSYPIVLMIAQLVNLRAVET